MCTRVFGILAVVALGMTSATAEPAISAERVASAKQVVSAISGASESTFVKSNTETWRENGRDAADARIDNEAPVTTAALVTGLEVSDPYAMTFGEALVLKQIYDRGFGRVDVLASLRGHRVQVEMPVAGILDAPDDTPLASNHGGGGRGLLAFPVEAWLLMLAIAGLAFLSRARGAAQPAARPLSLAPTRL